MVCVDEALHYAVPVLGAHRGGGNELARRVAETLGAEPVITTASDAAGSAGLDEFGADLGFRDRAGQRPGRRGRRDPVRRPGHLHRRHRMAAAAAAAERGAHGPARARGPRRRGDRPERAISRTGCGLPSPVPDSGRRGEPRRGRRGDRPAHRRHAGRTRAISPVRSVHRYGGGEGGRAGFAGGRGRTGLAGGHLPGQPARRGAGAQPERGGPARGGHAERRRGGGAHRPGSDAAGRQAGQRARHGRGGAGPAAGAAGGDRDRARRPGPDDAARGGRTAPRRRGRRARCLPGAGRRPAAAGDAGAGQRPGRGAGAGRRGGGAGPGRAGGGADRFGRRGRLRHGQPGARDRRRRRST